MATEKIMSRSSSSCSDAGSLQEELDNNKKIIMDKHTLQSILNQSVSPNILNSNKMMINNRGSVDNLNDNNSKINKSKEFGLKKKLKSTKKIGRRDPERFAGEGINFKAKLIGSQDVPQARGEKMAQEALQELKNQKKLSGEHKRRIIINIAIDGLRIREEKKKEVFYFHAVHKISFISQDPLDNRAFGYIYGSPDNVHTFFAIKSEKLAHQIVMCMRDLFQIAFELKKREIEQWRQQQLLSSDNKKNYGQSTSLGTDSNDGSTVSSGSRRDTSSPTSMDSSNSNGQSHQDPFSPSIFDEGENLLEMNMANNQQRLVEMKLVPIDVETMASSADNFFDNPWEYMKALSTSENALEEGGDPFDFETSAPIKSFIPESPVNDPFNTNFIHVPFAAASSTPCIPLPVQSHSNLSIIKSDDRPKSACNDVDKYAALAEISFEVANVMPEKTEENNQSPFNVTITQTSVVSELDHSSETIGRQSQQPDVNTIFSDLDPLGKDRPYVDKKDFFYDVKNPPKKVLNDMLPKDAFPLPDFNVKCTDEQTAKEVAITSASPPTLPPPLPPPFTRRPRVASPISNLPNSDGTEVPRPISRSSLSFSSSPSLSVPEVLLPPPPPPPPRSQLSALNTNLATLPSFNSPMNKNDCRDSVYSSSGSSDGSSSPTGDGPITPPCTSSSLTNFTAPIPIPGRREKGAQLSSSLCSSGISSAHNSGSFSNASSITDRPFSKWPAVPTNTILSPPPVNSRKSLSNDHWNLDKNTYNRHNQLQRTNNEEKDIFNKDDDPFNDDDFFSALRPNSNSLR